MTHNKLLKEYVIITIALTITAISAYFFLIPANLVVGSVTGIAMLISQVAPVSIATVTLILNIGLLILGYFLIGKDFGMKTVYASLVVPVYFFVFEYFVPNPKPIMNDPWLDLVTFILLLALSQTLLFRVNASSGGLDVVAKILNKFLGIPIGAAVSMSGAVVSLSAIFVYELNVVILGMIGTYLNGLVVNHFTDSFNQKKRVCILSERYEEIADYIMNVLTRGVTLYPIVGGYTKKSGYEIQIVVENNEMMELLNHVKAVDENAFISISSVHSIQGRWRSKREVRQLRKQQNNVKS